MKIKIEITSSQTDIFNNTEIELEVHEVNDISDNLELDSAILDYVSSSEYDFMIKHFGENPFLKLLQEKHIKYPKIETSNSSKLVEVFAMN